MVILLVITITISSNVIGTIAALFFANSSIQLSLDTWLQSDSWSSQSYWVYPANSTYHRTSHNKHSNKHLSLKYWEISKMEITNCENFDISPKQIEENQSKIIVDERLPSCSLSLIKKVVLIIFTTANDVPKPFSLPFDVFSDLKKRKHKNHLEKHHTGARAPTLSKNPMEPP